MDISRILLAGTAVLTLLATGCENSSDEAVIASAAIDEPSPTSTQVELARVDVVETEDSVTLHARGPTDAEIGTMRFDRVTSDDALLPAEAEGYFDITGLSEAEVEQRADALEVTLDYAPLENRLGCALKMAQAIAVCMDEGDLVLLTCPIGLRAVLCECGPQFGLTEARLGNLCTL